jgi:NADP-dependent 3-hydroxy acid dehydrogenase YdfG
VRELKGRTAFVTGGASGIGLALGRAFLESDIICNNAGVAAGGGIDNIALDNWRWVIDVNLMGVLHGIRSFLPHMRSHGEGGYIAPVLARGPQSAGALWRGQGARSGKPGWNVSRRNRQSAGVAA